MAMPLTAAATNYYTVHLEFKDKAQQTSSSAVTPLDASAGAGAGQPPRVRESVRFSAISLLEILKDMNTFADGLQKPSIYPMGIDGEQPPHGQGAEDEEEEEEDEDKDKDSSASEDSAGEEKRGGDTHAAAGTRVKRPLLQDPRMPRNASVVLKHVHSLFMALDELLTACKVDLRVMLELQLELKSKKQ